MSIAQFLLTSVITLSSLIITFRIKTRTNLAIGILILQLAILQLFNISIASATMLRELILSFTAYCFAVLFLVFRESVSRETLFEIKSLEISKTTPARVGILVNCILIGVVFVFSVATSLSVSEIPKISQLVLNNKRQRQQEIAFNPMILPSHPVHIAVKKFYLNKKFKNSDPNEFSRIEQQSEYKRIKLKENLEKKIFLRRSSEIFLICTFVILALLVFIPF